MPSTDLEQALLELVNATRLDPMGDAARYISSYSPLTSPDPDIQSALNYFQVSGSLLLQQFSALTPARPLAWNEQLATAARLHNAAMIAADQQSHQLPGERSLGDRIRDQGYNFTTAAENIYAFSESPLYAHAGFMVDWGPGTGGMQTPPGHRIAIMNDSYRELGIGITLEANGATSVGPQVVTQNFGSRGNSGVFVLGVAFTDANDDGFYTVGEGTAGLNVAVGAANAASSSSGGYTLSTAATGSQVITLTGGGLAGAVTVAATFANGLNAKLDVVDGQELRTSVSANVSGPITVLQGLGLTGLALTTGAGAQTLVGTKGHDTLSGNAGNDILRGGDGNDVVLAGSDDDSVYGGTGNDLIVGEDGNDSVEGEAGNDSIDGRAGNDTLLGGAEVDIVFGDAGLDRVYGGDGSDVLMGERGGVSTSGGNDTIWGDADPLALSGGNDTLDGDAGDDLLYGGGGNDVILGDNGNDTIEGGAGADIMGGSAASIASAETTGNDTFVYRAMTDAGDTIYGFDLRPGDADLIDLAALFDGLGYGGGNARVDGWLQVTAAGPDALVRIDVDGTAGGSSFATLLTLAGLSAGSVTDSFFRFLDPVTGTADGLANLLVGNAAANALSGLGGNDTIEGRGGNDTLAGDAGDDSLLGGNGADLVFGGADNDIVYGGTGHDLVVGEAGNDLVFGETGNDSIDGGAGDDTLHGQEEVDILFGDAGADLVLGGTGSDVVMGERGGASTTGGNDTLYGDLDATSAGGGDDTIDGDAGDDVIYGGSGNDVILGDNGNDTIEGGPGADIMGGSAASLASAETTGSDVFVYRSMSDGGDSIYGFDIRAGNIDRIDLRPLFDVLGYTGTQPRAAGYLRVQQSGADALVQVDANGSTGGATWVTLATLVERTATSVTDGFFLFQ